MSEVSEQRNRDSDIIGRTIGHYEIIRELGRGGMATVYLAKQANMKRQVAVKVLPREFLHDPQFIERFKREVNLIAELEHPHILPVYDFGEVEGIPFIVMRYLGGGSMRDMLLEGLPPLADLVGPITQVCSALDFAHAEGIIHRDLKPSNIMLDERGNAYLSDFGIAQIMQDAGRLTGSAVIGTPTYMSPEQAEGRPLDARADVYAMGVVLFELVTGREPFQADTPMAMLLKQITEPMPSPRAYRLDLPQAVEEVILKATMKDSASRHASAGEFAKAYAGSLSGLSVEQTSTRLPLSPAVERTYVPGEGAREIPTAPDAAAPPGEGFVPTVVPPTPPPGTTPSPVAAPVGRPAPTPAPAARPARRRGGLWIGLAALVVVIVVGGGALLFASGALTPAMPTALPTLTPLPTDTPGPPPTPAPPTPFARADIYRGPDSLYQVSIPGGWQRESESTAGEVFVKWFPRDHQALVAIRVYNTGPQSVGQFDTAMQDYEQAYYGDERFFTFIDRESQDDGSVRYSYRVPQPGGLYEIFGPGQVDVFYYQAGPYFIVLEFFTADEADDVEALLTVLQEVLNSLYVDQNVEWGEAGPTIRTG